MKRTKSITLEDDVIEYIEALKKETGIGSFSGVVERVFLSIMLTNEYKIDKFEIVKEEVIKPKEEVIKPKEEVIEPKEEIVTAIEEDVILEEVEPIVERDNTAIESGRVRVGRGSEKLDKINFGKNKKEEKKTDEKKR